MLAPISICDFKDYMPLYQFSYLIAKRKIETEASINERIP